MGNQHNRPFDNRSTIREYLSFLCANLTHMQQDTPVIDYADDVHDSHPRHIFRLAAMAEKPIPVPSP
jgi:sulfonate dioxygenase